MIAGVNPSDALLLYQESLEVQVEYLGHLAALGDPVTFVREHPTLLTLLV